MKQFTKLSGFLLVLMCMAMPASAAIAVIVHPDNANALDEMEVRRIFLGKARAFPDGSDATPVDQAVGSVERAEFVSKLLRKNEGNLNAYWARMLFSSKAAPPKMVGDSTAVKAAVAENPHYIGYINAKAVDDTVRVLLLIP